MKIAVLLTCFNRKLQTLSCLENVLNACNKYNSEHTNKINLSFFITDDKCTDGTPDVVKDFLKTEDLTIIPADGNAYWAGGMRLAWRKALESDSFDFYLLLNDDTKINEDCFKILMDTHSYCISHFGKEGVYTAFINDPDDKNRITYGAKEYKKGLFYKAADMLPTGIPQECTMPNANILMVSKKVCASVGILSDDYIHGGADWDYGFLCKNAGFPVLTTSHVCGACKNDHKNASEEAKLVKKMTIKERKKFVNRPTREYRDGFTFLKKYNKVRYLMLCVAYVMNIYMPNIYYKLLQMRGH